MDGVLTKDWNRSSDEGNTPVSDSEFHQQLFNSKGQLRLSYLSLNIRLHILRLFKVQNNLRSEINIYQLFVYLCICLSKIEKL